MEFVKGKWYKWNQTDHGQTHIGKFKTVNNGVFYMEPWLMGSETFDKSGAFLADSAKDIKCIDVSEIQKHLPEGHEDKFPNKPASIFDGLIEGNYYRYQYGKSYFCIGVCKDRDAIKYGARFDAREYWTDVFFCGADSVHPATPEEIEHLNACIAAGKYVDKPEKWVPKVGEWAVVIRKGNAYNIKIGECYKIHQLTDTDLNFQDLKGKKIMSSWIGLDECRKALPHEIPQEKNAFKPSDTWEATEDTCKRCANIHYHGSVNSGPHNLCEGSRCGDMEELEHEEKQYIHNLTPNKNEHKTTIQSLSIREEHISIAGIERPSIKSIRSEGSKVEITKYDRQAGIRSITG